LGGAGCATKRTGPPRTLSPGVSDRRTSCNIDELALGAHRPLSVDHHVPLSADERPVGALHRCRRARRCLCVWGGVPAVDHPER
jgi:hypothetical protein